MFKMYLTTLAVLFVLSLSVSAQTNARYSFKRLVTVQDHHGTVTRQSTFTFNNKSEQVETDIVESGKLRGINDKYWLNFPNPEINGGTMKGFTVVYTDEHLANFTKGVETSGLLFPVSALAIGKRTVSVRYYDWRIFRTSVVITEDGQ